MCDDDGRQKKGKIQAVSVLTYQAIFLQEKHNNYLNKKGTVDNAKKKGDVAAAERIFTFHSPLFFGGGPIRPIFN